MFPIGLAAVDQGYNDAATNYWTRRQLESAQAAREALGNAFSDMSGGFVPGPPQMSLPASGGGSGGGVPQPQGGGGRMQGGGGRVQGGVYIPPLTPAPDYEAGIAGFDPAKLSATGDPTGQTSPYSAQQSYAATMAAIPGGSGAQPAPVAGGMPGGPPGAVALRPPAPAQAPPASPGGMAGQPTLNLPGGAPGPQFGGGASGGRQPPTWYDLAAAIKAKNPDIKPDVFFQAMDMASKSFLNPQAQLAYRLETLQIREQMLQLQRDRLQQQESDFQRRMQTTERGQDIRAETAAEAEAGRGKRQDRAIGAAGERQDKALDVTRRGQDIRAETAAANREAAEARQTERLSAIEQRQANVLAQRSPEVRALTTALSQTEKQKSAVDSFADTELANLQRLVELADKVDSTGVPAIERWLRAGKKATGDKDVAAFDFQLGITRPGIARIVSSPNMTGSLTNQARSEINAGMGEGISAEQLHWIQPLIERDISTRKQSIDTQVDRLRNELRQRLPTSGPAAPLGPASAPSTAPAVGAPAPVEGAKTIGGKTYYPLGGGRWSTEPPANGGEGAAPFEKRSMTDEDPQLRAGQRYAMEDPSERIRRLGGGSLRGDRGGSGSFSGRELTGTREIAKSLYTGSSSERSVKFKARLLDFLDQGLSNKEIARNLGIRPNTTNYTNLVIKLSYMRTAAKKEALPAWFKEEMEQ